MSVNWDVFDVAFVGTSLTYELVGGWVSNADSQMKTSTNRPVRFYNFGVPGATTATGIADIATPVRMRPRAIVIEYGMNDSYIPSGISVSAFSSNLGQIVDSVKTGSPNTRIFLMTMNPVVAPRLDTNPDWAAYYQAIRNLSVSKSVGLIDNTPDWGSPTSAEIPDGIHPTVAKNIQIVVPNVLEALLPIL